MPYLVVENGPQKGHRVELGTDGVIAFGRDPKAELSVDDHLCSRRHFEIRAEGGGYSIEDLGSSNGTYVNDQRLAARTPLNNGDGIQAGETQITFLDDGAAGSKGLAGREIAGYRIIERIGRGGMGTVFKAQQVSLNRVVALKLLRGKLAGDPTFVKRFQREAQAAGRLNHPNVVQVYDVGQKGDLHFISMEFLENGTVQDLLNREGSLDPEIVLAIAMDAARGLEYAEKKHLVHRDIKPDNLMLGADGVVKIADLGLAHPVHGPGEDEGIFGTPHFISPEQARGEKVDPRSDIYSLGASLYFLLSGHTPFDGENVREIIYHQIHSEAPALKSQVSACPTAFSDVVAKMMAKDPAERHQNATEVLSELEAVEARLSGQGGGKKGLMIGAAAVVVIGAVAAFALGGNGDPADPGPGTTDPKPITNKPDKQEPDLEQLRLAKLQEAKLALAKVQLDDARLEKREVETLRALAARYAKEVIEPFAKLEGSADELKWRKDAQDRVKALEEEATAIEAEAARVAAAEEAARTAAAGVVEEARKARDAAIEKDAFGEALGVLLDAVARPELLDRPEAKTVDDLILELETTAAKRADVIEAEAEAKSKARDFSGALAHLEAKAALFEKGLPRSASAEAYRSLASRLRRTASTMERKRLQKRAQDLQLDQKVGIPALRSAYEIMEKGLQPRESRKALATFLPRTPEWKAMRDRLLADLDAADRVLAKLKAFDLGAKTKIKLPSRRDSSRSVTWTWTRTTEKGLEIEKGRSTRVLEFATLPAATLVEFVISERVAALGIEVLDCARLLALCGSHEKAQEFLESHEVSPSKDFGQRLKSEIAARAELAEIRRLEQEAARDSRSYLKLLPLAEAFLRKHRQTRTFLQNSNGTTPLVTPPRQQ